MSELPPLHLNPETASNTDSRAGEAKMCHGKILLSFKEMKYIPNLWLRVIEANMVNPDLENKITRQKVFSPEDLSCADPETYFFIDLTPYIENLIDPFPYQEHVRVEILLEEKVAGEPWKALGALKKSGDPKEPPYEYRPVPGIDPNKSNGILVV